MEKNKSVGQNRRKFLKLGTGIIGTGLLVGKFGFSETLKSKTEVKEFDKIFEVFKKRRSVRAFKSTPIPKEHLIKIIDAARLAPNAGNQLPWKFLVVRDRKKLDELKEKCITRKLAKLKRGYDGPPEETTSIRNYFDDYFSAPVYILVLIDTTIKYNQYVDKDGAIAAAHIILAARALGYGTVFCTDSIPEDLCKEVLNIPDKYSRTCITPVGVPRKWPKSPKKKSVAEVTVYETF